jgi:hypothetical protein
MFQNGTRGLLGEFSAFENVLQMSGYCWTLHPEQRRDLFLGEPNALAVDTHFHMNTTVSAFVEHDFVLDGLSSHATLLAS